MKIDWTLTSNGEDLIHIEDALCEYSKENYLKFLENEVINLIDLKNKLYKRKSKEYNMEIDFNNNICNFKFDTGESCSFDINSTMEVFNNEIKLRYILDDEEKVVKILLKG